MTRNLVAAIFFSLIAHGLIFAALDRLGPEPRDSMPSRHISVIRASLVQSAKPVFEATETIPVPSPVQEMEPLESEAPVIDSPVFESVQIESLESIDSLHIQEPTPKIAGLDASSGDIFTGTSSRSEGSPSDTGQPDSGPVLLIGLNPAYPAQARRLGIEGIVIVEVTIDPQGHAQDWEILKPRGHRILEKSAIEAVMNAQFRPAYSSGESITDILCLRIHFELEA